MRYPRESDYDTREEYLEAVEYYEAAEAQREDERMERYYLNKYGD